MYCSTSHFKMISTVSGDYKTTSVTASAASEPFKAKLVLCLNDSIIKMLFADI